MLFNVHKIYIIEVFIYEYEPKHDITKHNFIGIRQFTRKFV